MTSRTSTSAVPRLLVGRVFSLVAAMCLLAPSLALAAASKDSIPTVQPAALAAELKAHKPLHLFQVGFRVLYAQAHIPGSTYVGAGKDAQGLDGLRAAVKSLPKDADIVLYCGCCPWVRCPNVLPAYEALAALHFTHVRVLAIPESFGTDWVDKGFPTERGAPQTGATK